MKLTNFLKLKKPESIDYVQIEDLNENMDLLDGKVKELSETPAPHTHTKSQITDFPTTETWTFTLEDDSTVTKAVYIG